MLGSGSVVAFDSKIPVTFKMQLFKMAYTEHVRKEGAILCVGPKENSLTEMDIKGLIMMQQGGC
jgi:hypothetical protein